MRSLIALFAVAVLTLTGCGDQTATDSGSEPAALPSTGKVADLEFTSTTLAGETFDGTSLAGKPAVLWFWAPWCSTCRAQIPNLTSLAEEHEGAVEVVGVGGLDSGASIEALAEQIPHLTHLVDEEGNVWKHFGVTAQSTYTVIGAEGEIVTEGYLDDDELNALVERMVG